MDTHILTARPSAALTTFRTQPIAFISSTSAKPATALSKPGDVTGNPSTPPPMSVVKKQRIEVPLPSQEGKKGAIQYALYVCRYIIHPAQPYT